MSNGLKELFIRHPGNPILTVDDWPYPANSVFNAAAVQFDGQTLLLVRVEDRRGISHLSVARSNDGVSNWEIDPEPSFPPDPEHHHEELWGVEDPRITFIPDAGEYLITYTAYSEAGPLVSLARTRDFRKFERLGPIMPPEDKDAALLPVKFDGRWVMIHRPFGLVSEHIPAHIWISFSPDLKHWGDTRILMRARSGGWWDANKIGLSPPPMETPQGWLILYHGVRKTAAGSIYRLGAAMLDRDDPTKIVRRSDEWVFSPQETYERVGDVSDVVFSCGWVRDDDRIRLYYGAADTAIALAEASMNELLSYLETCPKADG